MNREQLLNDIEDLIFEAECVNTIKNEIDAIEANRILDAEVKLRNTSEKLRKEEKAPIIAQGKAIDEYFNSLKEKCQIIQNKVKPFVNDYLKEQERLKKEEAERLAAEAERAKEKAMARLEAQDNGSNGVSKIEALEAVREADKAAYDAKKAAYDANNIKITGGDVRSRGMKTIWSVEVTDPIALVKALATDERMQELAKTIANGMVKTHKDKLNLDGVKAVSKQTV